MDEEKKLVPVNGFLMPEDFMETMEDLRPEFAAALEKDFWELLA